MTSIFYVNTAGFLCQWEGRILKKTADGVSIEFADKRAFLFNLRDMDCGFFIATKTLVPRLGLSIDEAPESVSFDDALTEKVLAAIGDNIAERWTADGWKEGAQ